VIFCAGGFDALAEDICPGDFVIAADGGLLHTQKLGLQPDLILGDFDSLGYIPNGATVHPAEKDDTDAMLAVRQGLQRGYREFRLYGCLDGPRLDHTVAALQTLLFLSGHGAQGALIGLHFIATVVTNGTLRFSAGSSGILSLFCLGPDAAGVRLTGLKYPMEDGVLTAGFPLGVSNQFTGEAAEITVKSGSLIAIYDRENGIVPVHR
jgi:thiamine pyrophosphokinase